MTKQLIDGLRTAADWIESGKVDYDWDFTSSCNCGILAQVINKVSDDDITAEFGKAATWTKLVCEVTGQPIHKIIQTLLDVGMTAKDFTNLEFLTYDDVKPESWYEEKNLEHSQFNKPENVISYMRTWADSLERQLLNQSTKTKTTTKVTVSC
jgi:hypothetical protein